MSEAIVTVLIAGLLSVVASLIAVSAAAKKAPAETAVLYQDMANKQGVVNAELVRRMDELQNKIDDLECQLMLRDRLIAEWQVGITRLIEQLEENKLTPIWRPRKIKED